MTPRYHIITLGCQMNKSDSERIEALLASIGFESAQTELEADLILINTCSVRQRAEDRVFGLVRNFAKLKKNNPRLLIGITGCMAGRDKDKKFHKKMPEVDLYFPIHDMVNIPRWIAEFWPDRYLKNIDLVPDYLNITPNRHAKTQAFVTIQTGCNKFCSYCVVPFARGLEKNRLVKDILEEIKNLANQGYIEITLLGQTVNSYKAPDPEFFSSQNPYKNHFAALLWEINQINGISRLHFTAPHPIHMNSEVIDAMSLKAHFNFLHLPVQSGNNEILRRMNRRYSREDYLLLTEKIKTKLPNIAIGTDIIVGFSGETKEQFEQTLELYRQVEFDISYNAMYCQRSGTLAAKAFKDDVSLEEKKERWNALQELMEEIVFKKNQAYIGKTVSVLVERYEPNRKKIGDQELRGMCVGNSREMKLTQFPGSESLIGQVVDVFIEDAGIWILTGRQKL